MSGVFVKFTLKICLFAMLLFPVFVSDFVSDIKAAPILDFTFNDGSGTSATSSGTAPNQVLGLYSMGAGSTTIVPTNLHTAPGTGVAGNIVGSALYGTDQAFNASGGIAVNETSTAVSGLTSWTVSGWYDASTGLIAGSAFFQTPGDNSFGSDGFAIRGGTGGKDLRIGLASTFVSTTTTSFDPINEWIFFAVSYNGTLTSNNVKVYEGFRNASEAASAGEAMSVTLVSTLTLNDGTALASLGYSLGARLNSTSYGTLSSPSIIQSMPAVFDNFRVDSGALSVSQLEAYRSGDVAIAPNNFVWSSTSNTSWENSSSWASSAGTSGSAPDGSGLTAIFGTIGTTGSVVLNTGHTLGSLMFMGSVGTTINGTGTLTFSSTSGWATISGSGTNAIDAPVALSVSTSALLTAGNRLTIGGSISGSGSLGISGSGVLTLSGDNAYTGTTLLSGGTLLLGNASALRASTFSATGGLLAFQPGIGDFNLGGLVGSGNLALTDTAGGAVDLSVGANNQNTSFSGILGGVGGIVKTGSGSITLSGSNTYTGGMNVSEGEVILLGSKALADGSSLIIGSALSGQDTVALRAPVAPSSVTPAPEPGTLVLLAATFCGLGLAASTKGSRQTPYGPLEQD